ncbi:MAG: demethoxyubiquinone hydroxylase family protein, partial [Rhizomicrobium sp.]|nr:demethoxyubiquinone hydroxylase family protein [Rhizomicrobium sp.]
MRKPRPAFPGPVSGDDTAAMIRVDHAGEFGAVRIYAGQMAVFGKRNSRAADAITHMAAQEAVHLKRFETLLNERRVRPTALEPFWRVAGFALGAATAMMGERAAMACTEAVEAVIDQHYGEQLERLGDSEADLTQTIAQFRTEEVEHHDAAIALGSEEALGHGLLTA